ncbi:restriction endonuclease, partial [Candidatus Bathyarchaeota archaeon]|nr:restriction endonuclease [Candidatus Bathyarchaeota archaeon]
MKFFVTKADGTKQLFNRKKVIRTCIRMGASQADAESISYQIEKRIYNGITTKKILQMIFRYLEKHKPIIKKQIDLRRALSLINPAPEFEQFIQLLLAEHGYQVTQNQII